MTEKDTNPRSVPEPFKAGLKLIDPLLPFVTEVPK